LKQLLLACVLMISACASAPKPEPKYLPHRPTWESYAIQGLYSQKDCPGQYADYIYDINTDTGEVVTFFLGCWGERPNDQHN